VTPEQIQELINALDLNQHDFIIEAVLVARVKDMDSGAVGISISATDDTDWVTQLGVLRAAEIITTKDVSKHDGQD
jgi:3-keto-L-gulonate-6-phosphate decarboxylase